MNPTIELGLPPLPLSHSELGIGIVGSGSIVRLAHLPAYQMAGFRVAAISGRNDVTREAVAGQFNIPVQVSDWRILLDRDDVDVLDIAILGEGRVEIVRAAAAAGKHLLVQKPLANTLDEAREMVAIAKDSGILLAVNQNARWAPVYRAAHSIIRQGIVGSVFDIVHVMRNTQGTADWFVDGWGSREPRYQIVQYMVHYLDIVRMWTDAEPEWVTATLSRRSSRPVEGEMSADVLMSFPGDITALVSDRNNCRQDEPVRVGFSIEGTDGYIEGDVQTGKLIVGSSRLPAPIELAPPGNWFPDAFAHTMGDLLGAIAGGSPLSVSGDDNLNTLAIVEAAYQSAAERRSVKVE